MKGLLGLVHLVLVVAAIIDLVKSSVSNNKKILWALITIFVPLVGPILYFVIGKKK